MQSLRRSLVRSAGAIALSLLGLSPSAQAFPGLYVAKDADAELNNHTSQVVIARDGNRTTLTMLNDYEGSVGEFALIVPVPGDIQPEQIRVVDPRPIKLMNFLSSPRIVFDPLGYVDSLILGINACAKAETLTAPDDFLFNFVSPESYSIAYNLYGLKTTGEYDLTIWDAAQAGQLEAWLQEQGYAISASVRQALQPYIQQNWSFVVANIMIPEFEEGKRHYLNPLQITYNSPQFTLPIQLGKLNSAGIQKLNVHLFSPQGQVEVANYLTAKVPTEISLPQLVAADIDEVYQAILGQIFKQANRDTIILESAFSNKEPLQGRFRAKVFDDLFNPQSFNAAWLTSFMIEDYGPDTEIFFTGFHLQYAPNSFTDNLVFYTTRIPQNFEVEFEINYYEVDGSSELKAEQCAEGIVEEFRNLYKIVLEQARQESGEHSTDTRSFSDFLRERLAHLSEPESRKFGLLSDQGFLIPETFPLLMGEDDPVDYIARFTQHTFAQHEVEVTRRLEAEAQTLAELTGWPLDEIRQRITAEHDEVPESWRQRYPAP